MSGTIATPVVMSPLLPCQLPIPSVELLGKEKRKKETERERGRERAGVMCGIKFSGQVIQEMLSGSSVVGMPAPSCLQTHTLRRERV